MTKILEKELIDSAYKNYAIYTLESRAIPSVIDGMKPVHRKIMCLALSEARNRKMKVADFGSISKLGYRHGEVSAQDAAVGLASDWNNNVPLLEGHGDFGSRICHHSAAPRYIYAKVSSEWDRYFDSIEVCPEHPDPDFVEPAYYLPIVPWVLVNGIQGIAVGFAVNILPRDPKDLEKACTGVLDELPIPKTITPSFPNFKGTVIQGPEGHKHWLVRGVYELSRNTYRITELPVGWDREKYADFLNSMMEKGKIKDYSDLCDESGFVFEVKVTGEQKAAIEKNPYKELRLEKSLHENFTVLDVDGKPMVMDSVSDIVEYFVKHRVKKYDDYIQYRTSKINSELQFLKDKMAFVNAVVDYTIELGSIAKKELEQEILNTIEEPANLDRLIRIPAYTFTTDTVKALQDDIDKLDTEYQRWKRTTGFGYYRMKLKGI